MSRSKKGSKPPGFDFWSRRPHSNKNDKDLTHRAERREGKEVSTGYLERPMYKCWECGRWFYEVESGSHVCRKGR